MADGFIEKACPQATDLSARFARGETDVLPEMIALYAPRVASLARRLMGYRGDVDDLVQDVFVAAIESRSRFRGDCSLWTWLTRITINRCRWHGRKQKVRRLALPWLRQGSEARAADTDAIQKDMGMTVRAAVLALRLREREIIVLHYFEQLSIAQIGHLLGKKESAVAVQLHRARQRLRELLPNDLSET